jgi:hypothetical protein
MNGTLRLASAALVAIAVCSSSIIAATSDAPVSYSARLVNFDEPMGRASGLVQVRVTRWSTDADRDALTSALLNGGQSALLAAVSRMPEAGVLRTPGTAGYPFRYARRIVDATGGAKVIVIIDRPIGFVEFRQGWQTRDYPFTVVELTLDDRGEGTGRLLAAAQIDADPATGDISFEQFSATPMLLQSVREE